MCFLNTTESLKQKKLSFQSCVIFKLIFVLHNAVLFYWPTWWIGEQKIVRVGKMSVGQMFFNQRRGNHYEANITFVMATLRQSKMKTKILNFQAKNHSIFRSSKNIFNLFFTLLKYRLEKVPRIFSIFSRLPT
jgi:hypothetical protein